MAAKVKVVRWPELTLSETVYVPLFSQGAPSRIRLFVGPPAVVRLGL
jgi:hypothetical protein